MGGVQPVVPRGQPICLQETEDDGEPGQTAGWSSCHYEGRKPDALQGCDACGGTEEYL